MHLCCFESKYVHQTEVEIKLNLLFIDVDRMCADHLATVPECEGMRRHMTLIPGVNILDQNLKDTDLLINHYTTAIHTGECCICYDCGPRFENPTCLMPHPLCGNCMIRAGNRCPVCLHPFYVRLRIRRPDAERKTR